MKQRLYYLHSLSALHVGIGQGTGIIDLPIAREKASNLPQVPGSAVKGVLRDELRDTLSAKDNNDFLALFGPETGETASEYAGALAVGDARLLCLPIRSWHGTFAWASCPMILQRYRRDLGSDLPVPVPAENEALYYLDSESATQLKDDDKIYLEDLDLNATKNSDTDAWADHIASAFLNTEGEWQKMFKQRFVILADNVFDFLAETATEIRARIRIEEGTRTVQTGALWYEEYLPAETLLWGTLASDRSRKSDHPKSGDDMLNLLPTSARLQIGGKATVGAGQVRWVLPSQPEEK